MTASRLARSLLPDALCIAALVAVGGLALTVAAARAQPARLSFGPNDGAYVRGMRPDWERDGHTRFRWTGPAARITLPLRLEGEEARLRLRLRRHFVDPARVTLRVEGRVVHRFEIAAERDVPYRVESVALPPLSGDHPLTLDVESAFDNPRPLGVALDWMAIERGAGRFRLLPETTARALLALVAAFALLRLAGAAWRVAAAAAVVLALGLALGVATDIVASERVLSEGLGVWVAVGAAATALVRSSRVREALGVDPRMAPALVGLVLLALAIRLAILLHPLYFYPDVRVHALFSLDLAKRGLVPFLADFTQNQFRHSLGLQFESGHWYAFPYPPAFYLLTWPLVAGLGFRPEIAVSALAAVANALEVVVVFAIARRLLARPATALAAAAAVPLLPLFIVRLSLAYFPALFGHFLDALVLLYLASRLDRLERPRVVAALGALVALALLAYTQAIVNFAFLFASLLLTWIALDRTPTARRRQVGLAAAGLLGAALAVAVFYGRYIPIFVQMQQGIPMPEEAPLLERMERQSAAAPAPPEEADDPYAGPGVNPLRGLRKAGWRLWLFYGPFSLLVVTGWVMLLRARAGPLAWLIACWGGVYLLLNLGSAGLPGPNLLRYNKDLEVIAPLVCLCLVVPLERLASGGRRPGMALAAALALGFLAMAAVRAHSALIGTFDLADY